MISHQNSAAHHFDFSYFYDINIYYFLYYNKNVQKVQQFYTYKLLVQYSITTQVPNITAFAVTAIPPSLTLVEDETKSTLGACFLFHPLMALKLSSSEFFGFSASSIENAADVFAFLLFSASLSFALKSSVFFGSAVCSDCTFIWQFSC